MGLFHNVKSSIPLPGRWNTSARDSCEPESGGRRHPTTELIFRFWVFMHIVPRMFCPLSQNVFALSIRKSHGCKYGLIPMRDKKMIGNEFRASGGLLNAGFVPKTPALPFCERNNGVSFGCSAPAECAQAFAFGKRCHRVISPSPPRPQFIPELILVPNGNAGILDGLDVVFPQPTKARTLARRDCE